MLLASFFNMMNTSCHLYNFLHKFYKQFSVFCSKFELGIVPKVVVFELAPVFIPWAYPLIFNDFE